MGILVRLSKQGLQAQQDGLDVVGGRPLVFENIKADATGKVDIGVVDRGHVQDSRRGVRVVRGELEAQLEREAGVRGIVGARDGRPPRKQVAVGRGKGRDTRRSGRHQLHQLRLQPTGVLATCNRHRASLSMSRHLEMVACPWRNCSLTSSRPAGHRPSSRRCPACWGRHCPGPRSGYPPCCTTFSEAQSRRETVVELAGDGVLNVMGTRLQKKLHGTKHGSNQYTRPQTMPRGQRKKCPYL